MNILAWFPRSSAERRAEREAYLKTLQSIVETQAKTTEMVLAAVNGMTATQARQVDAITAHLNLFKTVEAPTAMALTGYADNKAWAEQQDFPFEGTPEQQAEWIATHDVDD